MHPDERRAEVDAFSTAVDEARAAMLVRTARLEPPSDAEIIRWVLAVAPTSELEWLDYRDAERGRVSEQARRRYEGRMHRPQVGPIVWIPRNAEYCVRCVVSDDRLEDALALLHEVVLDPTATRRERITAARAIVTRDAREAASLNASSSSNPYMEPVIVNLGLPESVLDELSEEATYSGRP